MKTIKDLPIAGIDDITDDTLIEVACTTGGTSFTSHKLTYKELYQEFENRIRYEVETCVIRDPCIQLPDEPIVLPPVIPPAEAPQYNNGLLCIINHTSRGANFDSKYDGITNPLRLPNLVSTKMDWALAPQYTAILNPPTLSIKPKTFGNSTWFPGEPKLPKTTTYPYITPTSVYAEAGVGFTVMARYFGYIKIQESALYGFRFSAEEGGTMWFGTEASPDILGYECVPTTVTYPFINADTNSTDGAGKRYFTQAQTQKGNNYLNFSTLYNGNASFQSAVQIASSSILANPSKADQHRVYLTAGLYPFMIDIWGGGDKYGEGFDMQWVKGAGGTYSTIPGNLITHKKSDWDIIKNITKPRPPKGVSHFYKTPTAYGYTTSYTAQLPTGGPNITYVPPHSYNV